MRQRLDGPLRGVRDRHMTCIEGRMERPTFAPPSPCSVDPFGDLVLHSPAYSRDAGCPAMSLRSYRPTARDGGRGLPPPALVPPPQVDHVRWGGQGIPGQDERKRSTRVMPPGGWDARPSATSVENCRLGSLSTGSLVGRPGYEDGLMYSQARVMPGNAGDSPARVIETSEKQGSGSTGHTTKLG